MRAKERPKKSAVFFSFFENKNSLSRLIHPRNPRLTGMTQKKLINLCPQAGKKSGKSQAVSCRSLAEGKKVVLPTPQMKTNRIRREARYFFKDYSPRAGLIDNQRSGDIIRFLSRGRNLPSR
ncbi:MAG TPA: hypothetical protein VMV05_12110 [bacterium]|nr:hypothetical protein [bacterium]